MKIENAFTVPAPVEQVFGLLSDVERVAPCMPGATILGRDDDQYRGRFRIKVGPVTAAYEGNIAVQSSDPERGEIVLRGQGTDPRGAGSAEAVIAARVEPHNGGAKVTMVTDLDVVGRLAQFSGRTSMMQSVADRVITQFARGLEGQLAHGAKPAGATAVNGSGGATATSRPSDAAPEKEKAAPAPGPAPAAADAEGDVFDAGSLLRDMIGGQAVAVVATVIAFVIGILVGRRSCRRGIEIRL